MAIGDSRRRPPRKPRQVAGRPEIRPSRRSPESSPTPSPPQSVAPPRSDVSDRTRRPPATPSPSKTPSPIPAPTFPEVDRQRRVIEGKTREKRRLQEAQERKKSFDSQFPGYINQLNDTILHAAAIGELKGVDRISLNPKGLEPGIYFNAKKEGGGGVAGLGTEIENMNVKEALAARLERANKEEDFSFMADMMLLHEALGYIEIGAPDPKTGIPEITELEKPKPADWEKVVDYLGEFGFSRGKSLISAPTLAERLDQVVPLLAGGFALGGPVGAAFAIPFAFPKTVPKPVKQTLGAIRRWEVAFTGDRAAAAAAKVGVPEVAIPFIRELAVPSTIAAVVAGKTRITTGAAFAEANNVTKFGRLFKEGSLFGAGDITYIAYGQGRDPTVTELLLGSVLGGVGEASLAMALPVVAKATGAALLKMPGGRRFLRITGRQFNEATAVYKEFLLEHSTITRQAFDGMLERVRSVSKKELPNLIGDSEGNFLLHGTSTKRMINITEQGLRLSEEGVTLPGAYFTQDFNSASVMARTQAKADNEVLGEIIAYKVRDGVRLLKYDISPGSEWLRVTKGLKRSEMQGPAFVDFLRKEGYGGVEMPALKVAKTAGRDLPDETIIFDADDIEFVGRVVDSDPTRAADQVTAMTTGRFKTASELSVGVDVDAVFRAADELASSRAPIPSGTDPRISQGAKGLQTESGALSGSGASRLFDDLTLALPHPKWRRLIERIVNDELDASVLTEGLMRSVDRPLPSSMFGTVINRAKSNFLLAPGLNKLTRSALVVSEFFRETLGEYVNSHSLAMLKVLNVAFGEEALRRPGAKIAGVRYTGPKATQTAQDSVIGNLLDMLERPEFYVNLTPEMRRAARIWDALATKDLRLSIEAGVDVNPITNRVYVPHVPKENLSDGILANIAAEMNKLEGRGTRARGVGGAHTLKRKYPTLFEFAGVMGRAGYGVELDPMALFVRRLTGGGNSRARAIYLQGVLQVHGRFDTSRGARARIGERSVDANIFMKKSEIKNNITGKVPKKQRLGPKDGRWFLPDDIAAEVSDFSTPFNREAEVKIAETVVDTLRATLLSVDLSFFTIQGYSLLASDPVRFFTQIGDWVPAISSREGHMLWMASNAHRIARFTQAGGTLYNSVLDLPSKRTLGGQTKQPIDRVPVAGWLNDVGFNRVLPTWKTYSFESNIDLLINLRDGTRASAAFERLHPKLRGVGAQIDKLFEGLPVFKNIFDKLGGVKGKTDFELERMAADVTNNLGGGINWSLVGRSPGLLSKTLILTEGWTRAKIGLIVQAAQVGHPAGVLARRMLFQQLSLAAILASAVSLWRGQGLPEFNPTESAFLDVKTEDGRVPIIPGKTAIRAAFRGIAGVPWDTEDNEIEQRIKALFNYGEGRKGQIPRVLADLQSGTDFFGRRIDNKVAFTAQSMLPIVVGEAWRSLEEGVRGWDLAKRLGIESLGLNFIPTSPFDNRNNAVTSATEWRETGKPFLDLEGNILTDHSQLNPDQKLEYNKWDESAEGHGYNAEIERDLELRSSPYAELQAIDEAHSFMLVVAGDLFLREDGTPGAAQHYRDRIAAIREAQRLSRQIKFNQSGLKESEPQTLDQRIYDGYFEEVVERSLDPELREALDTVDAPVSMDDTLIQLASDIDSDIFESLEHSYFSMIKNDHGQEALRKLQGWLGLRNQEDKVATAYRRDREVLDEGYYANRDSLFTPENLEEFGLPRSAASKFNTWEEYVNQSTVELFRQLDARPMPPELGVKETADGTTWYQLFAIDPVTPLNKNQARQVAQLVGNEVFKDFINFRTAEGNKYLKLHPQEICILEHWETRPKLSQELLPYARLCGTSNFRSFR